MITLPTSKEKLPKVCRECKTPVTKENGIVRSGYLIRLCLKCRKKKTDAYNEKRKKALKDSWF